MQKSSIIKSDSPKIQKTVHSQVHIGRNIRPDAGFQEHLNTDVPAENWRTLMPEASASPGFQNFSLERACACRRAEELTLSSHLHEKGNVERINLLSCFQPRKKIVG